MGDIRRMKLSSEEKQDKNIFKRILAENWEEFKKSIRHTTRPIMKKLSRKQYFAVMNRAVILNIGARIVEKASEV